jgi:hypothetical protein
MFVPLFGRVYPKITIADIAPHLKDLDLTIVGGLARRGWTIHDIDIIGRKSDVPLFVSELRRAHIYNAVHYCGTKTHHSHIQNAYYGIKLTLTGKGY